MQAKIAMVNLTLKIVLGILFVLVGCSHFAFPKPYMKIIPPFLPFPLFLALEGR